MSNDDTNDDDRPLTGLELWALAIAVKAQRDGRGARSTALASKKTRRKTITVRAVTS